MVEDFLSSYVIYIATDVHNCKQLMSATDVYNCKQLMSASEIRSNTQCNQHVPCINHQDAQVEQYNSTGKCCLNE